MPHLGHAARDGVLADDAPFPAVPDEGVARHDIAAMPRAPRARPASLVWPLPVYAAMIHDYVTRRLVHPAYVIGWLGMLAERLVMPLRDSETWMMLSAWFFVPLYQ